MEARNILIYLSLIYEGDWDKIYDHISKKYEINEEEANEVLSRPLNSKVMTILDDNFPDSLKNCYKCPFVLFYHGDISLIDCKFTSIAVVGSRKCSNYGKENTIKFVHTLAKELTIISGMAYGIDSIAHQACLDVKGKTIAVLGSGINYIYPPDNEDLYLEIKKKGLILSEYPDKTTPHPGKFPIRNRIVASLTHTVFIPEGKINSGTQITATMVLSQGGNVCCIPTLIGKESLCNHLIQNGAALVECPEEVFEEMQYKPHEVIFKWKFLKGIYISLI